MQNTGVSLAALLTATVLGLSGAPAAQAKPATEMPTRGLAALPPAGAAEADTAQHRHSRADVRFMQGMIPHHAQALVMAELVPSRSEREDIRLLAQRIEVAQQDEIAWMQRWLEERGEPVPSIDAHHVAHHHGAEHHPLMPGMLTREELARLGAARGAEFDRLFLEYMIRHHEGALVMVAELFATPGGGQEAAVFRFASDVDADQRAEIERIRRLLRASTGRAPSQRP
jgi:uncharacterized protein (DUF305 family)